MTKPLKLLLLFCLSTAFFSSCKKDSDDFEGMRVTIDGQLWTATTTSVISSIDTLTITGSEPATLKSLSILLPSTITAGTYYFDHYGGNICAFKVGVTTFLPEWGTLVVVKHDTGAKQIKGTIDFWAVDTLTHKASTFTGGEFNVKY